MASVPFPRCRSSRKEPTEDFLPLEIQGCAGREALPPGSHVEMMEGDSRTSRRHLGRGKREGFFENLPLCSPTFRHFPITVVSKMEQGQNSVSAC